MDEKQGFYSVEEFQRELSEWGRQWIALYTKYAVDISEEGDIAQIRGKLIFKKEFSRLCEPAFSREEIQQYEEETAKLRAVMENIHAKSRNYIASDGMVVMEYLYRMLGFDEFEWYLFCMAFLVETDRKYERVFCLLQDDFNKKLPTLDLCIHMYTLEEERQYELQGQVMRRWSFLEQLFDEEFAKSKSGRLEGILSAPMKLEERLVRFIYHMDSEDSILEEAVTCYLPSTVREPMLIRGEYTGRLKRMYEVAEQKGFVYLSGEHDIGKKFLVRQFCREEKRPLLMVDMQRFLKLDYPLEWLVKRLAREAVLKGDAVVCLADLKLSSEEEEAQENSAVEYLLHCLEKTYLTPVITSTQKWQEAIQTGELKCIQMELPDVSCEERKSLWESLLAESTLNEKEIRTERLARTYRMPPGAIVRVIRETENIRLTAAEETPLEKLLYEGCQRQLIHNLQKDAVQIPAQYTMEELILPASQKKLLRDACNMVEYHQQVFETWGFDKKMAYGKGVSMIFYGPPGTGKTMGAQVIANELNLELYRVDMASVLSKYVGESEKKLGNIFEQGQKSQSILFFDEADALFGKRSEVKDSQDKYANASTAFLLQKLEEYQGIIILATNLLQNFDQAFCRRFQFIIEFPAPDVQRRKEIWESVFPEEMPKEEIDFDYLAEEFVLSGSQIKNIAVSAAFLAAGAGEIVGMVHILRSMKREMKKTGKNMIASDFGIYYSLMEDMEGE